MSPGEAKLAVFYYFLAPSRLGLTVGMWRNSAAKDEEAVDWTVIDPRHNSNFYWLATMGIAV